MRQILFITSFLSILTFRVFGQEINQAINKDSLLQAVIKDLPEFEKNEILKEYNQGNKKTKEDLIVFYYLFMPKSNKKEMIANIDSNFDKISYLKTEYLKLVPKNYIVSIEFYPADNIIMTKESIDLKIEHTSNNQSDIEQDWNLEYNSKKLAQMLEPIGWTNETLQKIKKLLIDANCVSIENGDITTIGFARSGLGKYYFKLFDSDLTNKLIEQYNDGCTYIFYKKNIVLEYGGGAAGSQCFPD